MKRACGVGVAGLVLVLLTLPVPCHGTSGSTWHVTVRNPTEVEVSVTVWYATGKLDWAPIDQNTHILPGGEHRFNVPGAKCPAGLNGTFQGEGWSYFLRDTAALGHEAPSNWWTAVCANLTFEICRKAGTPQDSPRNGDFGFCKK